MRDISPDALAVALGILAAVWLVALLLARLFTTGRGPDDQDRRTS